MKNRATAPAINGMPTPSPTPNPAFVAVFNPPPLELAASDTGTAVGVELANVPTVCWGVSTAVVPSPPPPPPFIKAFVAELDVDATSAFVEVFDDPVGFLLSEFCDAAGVVFVLVEPLVLEEVVDDANGSLVGKPVPVPVPVGN
jgi:hypothetical protein